MGVSIKEVVLSFGIAVMLLCAISANIEVATGGTIYDLFWVQWLNSPVSELKIWKLLIILWFFAIISREGKVK